MSEKLQPENEEIFETPEELAKEVIKESEIVDGLKNVVVSLNVSGPGATKEALLGD